MFMKGTQQRCCSSAHSLKFMSINVGRGGTTQYIALARASELKLDVFLVQEPWWSGNTKLHPYFDHYSLFVGTKIRPRAVTFIRKSLYEIFVVQKFAFSPVADNCCVPVNGITF